MDHGTAAVLRDQLVDRRQRLEAAISGRGEPEDLVRLLHEVDSALGRMDGGTYGRCEVCSEDIDDEELLANPLVRYCLCRLSAAQLAALQNDLDLAKRIQSALLPMQDLRVAAWEAHYHYAPAGPVSGDYCDLLPRESGEPSLYFAVGDVSGKGVAASLLMAHLNASFRSLVGVGLSLDELVSRTNRLLLESSMPSHYATLVCGRGRASGDVEICNAGHCPPLVVRGGRMETLATTGLPVGMLEGRSYPVTGLHLDPGDTVVLYTDGVTEATNGRDEEYGLDRLGAVVGRHHTLAPRELAQACLADLDAFLAGTGRTDDVTLLVLRRAG